MGNIAERIATIFRAKHLPGSWVLLARVEGDESLFPAAERMTASFLRGVAESYDPAIRKAPVVSGWGGDVSGRAHEVGELNPPLGWVERVSFDGLNLWGYLSDVNGKLREAIDAGLERGSVSIWERLPVAEGKPYLRHFALLASEQPGIENLGSLLDDYFAGYDTAEAAVARELRETPYITRTTPTQQENNMEIEQALDKLSKLVVEGNEKLRSIDEKADASAKRIEALEAQNAELRQRTDRALEAVESNAKATRERAVRSAVEALSREGKVLPKEIDSEVGILTSLDEAKSAERLEVLRSRPAMKFAPAELPSFPTATVTFVRERDLQPAKGEADPEQTALVNRLMQESGGDYNKFRALAYAAEGQRAN